MTRKKVVKVEWAPGRQIGISAKAAFREIQEIERANNGVVTNETIVKKAKPRSSALHPHFDWIDSIAANRWRLRQAQDIKNGIRVTFEGEEDHGPTYYFVSFQRREQDTGQFTEAFSLPVEVAMSSADTRAEVLAEALRGLNEWQNRYGNLRELADLIRVIRDYWPGDENGRGERGAALGPRNPKAAIRTG